MAALVKWAVENLFKLKWLEGNRTKVVAVLLFVLAGARAAGWVTLDDKSYADLVSVISGAGLLAAAAHKPS